MLFRRVTIFASGLGKFLGVRSMSSGTGTASYELIKVEQVDGLRKVVLNDPKSRNALSLRMMAEIVRAVEENQDDKNLRAIVIGSSPGPVFSAGHNLKELTTDRGNEMQRAVFDKCTQLMLSLKRCEVPVFGAVNGLAAAAGCQLVAACDFAIATKSSKFSTPGASFGVFCSTPGVDVSRVVNRSVAAYMVMTGLPMSATEAKEAGLIARVVEDDQLDKAIDEIFFSICSKSRSVLKLGKQFFYKQLTLPYEEALRHGGDTMLQNLKYQDCQEGLESFKSKRKPQWTHDSKLVSDSSS